MDHVNIPYYVKIWPKLTYPFKNADPINIRSATTGTLLLPRAQTSTGQRSFAVFGPATWNSLPPSLRTPELSLSTFKRRLKTRLFQHP